jgi:hypothetical protein
MHLLLHLIGILDFSSVRRHQSGDLQLTYLMARSVVDDEIEPWRDTEDFAAERRTEFDPQLGGVELRGRREREHEYAEKAIQLRAHNKMIAPAAEAHSFSFPPFVTSKLLGGTFEFKWPPRSRKRVLCETRLVVNLWLSLVQKFAKRFFHVALFDELGKYRFQSRRFLFNPCSPITVSE